MIYTDLSIEISVSIFIDWLHQVHVIKQIYNFTSKERIRRQCAIIHHTVKINLKYIFFTYW